MMNLLQILLTIALSMFLLGLVGVVMAFIGHIKNVFWAHQIGIGIANQGIPIGVFVFCLWVALWVAGHVVLK